MRDAGDAARRLPKNYDAIRRVIEAGGPGSHHTTAEIYDRVRTLAPKIGYSTVQRGLARLSALGQIVAVRLPDEGGIRYEPRTSPHGHFLCSGCGAVLDVPYALPERTVERLATELGVRVEDHTVALVGRCGSCP
jgi:Fur family ferric uptake transcriptional regulator/Fur family peroxide stress response transcriptional regulator